MNREHFDAKPFRSIIDIDSLPKNFPTQRHDPLFWEMLGRTVATFGFLEETLGKAIFALNLTTEYSDSEIMKEFEKFSLTLERNLTDALGNLINSFERALNKNQSVTLTNPDELIGDLRKASELRNVLCHGSWRLPDAAGSSSLLFVDKKLRIFQDRVDIDYFSRTQRHVSELSCQVINTITHMGWQFPGTFGSGKPILGEES